METDQDPNIPPQASLPYRLTGALIFILAAVAGISTIRACKAPDTAPQPVPAVAPEH